MNVFIWLRPLRAPLCVVELIHRFPGPEGLEMSESNQDKSTEPPGRKGFTEEGKITPVPLISSLDSRNFNIGLVIDILIKTNSL